MANEAEGETIQHLRVERLAYVATQGQLVIYILVSSEISWVSHSKELKK